MILRFIKSKPLLWVALVILFITWYISSFWYQLMLLQGESMEPAYHSGQFLILDKHSKNYNYGDVIAIKKDNINGFLVKRIVAIPGDSVYINNGVLYINGEAKKEWQEIIDFAGIAKEPIVLREANYFVLGDNIKESKDSRYTEIGLINQNEIIGKVLK